MIIDIFIRTYDKDLCWLPYSLRSIHKFCSGFRNIIICIPESQFKLLQDFNFTQEKIVFCPDYKDDYLGQQITKISADNYSDADFVLPHDSDTLFTCPTTPESFFKEGKPVILKTKYSSLGNSVPWKKVTEKALGFEVEYEYMRRHPFIYHNTTLKSFRDYMQNLHKKEISQYVIEQPGRAFSEFNAIGAFADKFENHKYHFQDTETEELPPLHVRQFWSWGGITDEVMKEIDTILK